MSSEVQKIIDGCKKRDVKAQKELYMMYFKMVRAKVRLYVDDSDLANDLTQDSFIKIFDKIHTFNNNGSFDGWVKRLAANNVFDYYRKNNKLSKCSLDDLEESLYDETDEDSTFITQLSKLTSHEFLLKAIQQLEIKIRIVFILFAIENKTHEEISHQLNITVVNSRKRLQAARKWLKEYLIQYYNDN